MKIRTLFNRSHVIYYIHIYSSALQTNFACKNTDFSYKANCTSKNLLIYYRQQTLRFTGATCCCSATWFNNLGCRAATLVAGYTWSNLSTLQSKSQFLFSVIVTDLFPSCRCHKIELDKSEQEGLSPCAKCSHELHEV